MPNVFRVFSLRFFVSTLADYLSSRLHGWHALRLRVPSALPSHSYLAPANPICQLLRLFTNHFIPTKFRHLVRRYSPLRCSPREPPLITDY